LVVAEGHGLSLTGWIGLAVGIIGVSILLGVDVTGLAAFLIMGAAFSYATGAILISRLFADVDSLTTTAGMILTATPILLILALATEPFKVPTPSAWLELVLLGLACSAAGFAAFFDLIKRSGPTVASLTIYAAPIVAVLAGVLILGERFTLVQAVSCLLILAGPALVMRQTASPAAA
jgi:drug/metabolite transporter (DMT)-like permease